MPSERVTLTHFVLTLELDKYINGQGQLQDSAFGIT